MPALFLSTDGMVRSSSLQLFTSSSSLLGSNGTVGLVTNKWMFGGARQLLSLCCDKDRSSDSSVYHQAFTVLSNSGNKKNSKKQFPNDMIFSAIASMFPENGVPDDMKER